MSDSPLKKAKMSDVPADVQAALAGAFGPVDWRVFRSIDVDTGEEHGFSFNSGAAVVAWSGGKWAVATPSLCNGSTVVYLDSIEEACVRCVAALAAIDAIGPKS